MTPEQFDQEFGHEFTPTHPVNPGPYGMPAHPVKPGLTKRGKAALAIGATVIAGGSLLTWQHYSAEASAHEVKVQELALKQQELRIEEMKVLNEAKAATQKTQSAAEQTRQKRIDACVDTNKGLVGKQLGATYSSVVEDCQDQYPASTSGSDMEAAAASESTGTGGGNVSSGFLIGGAVLIGGVAFAVRRGTRNTTHSHHA